MHADERADPIARLPAASAELNPANALVPASRYHDAMGRLQGAAGDLGELRESLWRQQAEFRATRQKPVPATTRWLLYAIHPHWVRGLPDKRVTGVLARVTRKRVLPEAIERESRQFLAEDRMLGHLPEGSRPKVLRDSAMPASIPADPSDPPRPTAKPVGW